MDRKTIATKQAPEAIGPYSQAVRVGDFVFCSGQIALDPGTGKLVGGDSVPDQTRQCLANLSAVLEAAGASLASVVKTTVYMTDLSQFPAMNEVYAGAFEGDPPARATVGVRALPAGAVVEVEAVAQVEEGR